MDASVMVHKYHEGVVVDLATTEDAPAIKQIINAAYSKYIELMGTIPAAMKVDYSELVMTKTVYVLRIGTRVTGSIILTRDGDSIAVNNLVVEPSLQGQGLGRLLMEYAEATALKQGLTAMKLFANEIMYDNIAWYQQMGFAEIARKKEDGFNRVYFRKDFT